MSKTWQPTCTAFLRDWCCSAKGYVLSARTGSTPGAFHLLLIGKGRAFCIGPPLTEPRLPALSPHYLKSKLPSGLTVALAMVPEAT